MRIGVPTEVTRALARVNVAAIERNCARLAVRAGRAELRAVVKAGGYGHGALPVARAAQAGGASWLAVATAGEAAALRAGGVEGRLLVLGALSMDELRVALHARADVVAWRESFVAALADMAGAEGVGVHVKIDSGMRRLGTRDAAEATRVAEKAAGSPGLRLAGAMTHVATADDDTAFLRVQLDRFTAWAGELKAAHSDVIVHCANSAATLAEPRARLDMVRCGIHGLEPALELCSYVAEVNACKAPATAGGSSPRNRR